MPRKSSNASGILTKTMMQRYGRPSGRYKPLQIRPLFASPLFLQMIQKEALRPNESGKM
jgi:hypothetical protein